MDGALPGEEVACDVHSLKRNFAIGTLERVEVASEERVKPLVPSLDSVEGVSSCIYRMRGSSKQERKGGRGA